jgi:hypothetical protein
MGALMGALMGAKWRRGRGQSGCMNALCVGRGELGLLRRWGKEAGRAHGCMHHVSQSVCVGREAEGRVRGQQHKRAGTLELLRRWGKDAGRAQGCIM